MGMKIQPHSTAIQNAGRWFRDYAQIPSHTIIYPEFEKYFNCQVHYKQDDMFTIIDYIEFENDGDGLLFLLKWS